MMLRRISPFLFSALLLAASVVPFSAQAAALTTTRQVSLTSAVCSGSYISAPAALDTAYLPSDYATPGKYCIETVTTLHTDCQGNNLTTTVGYALYSGSSVSANGGSSTRSCSGGLNMLNPFAAKTAYAAEPRTLALANGGITSTRYNAIVYVSPIAYLSGGTSIHSGDSALLTWSSNFYLNGFTIGTCTAGSGTGGSFSVSPTNTTTYSNTCTLYNGSASDSASQTVTVIPPLSNATVSCSPSRSSATTGQSVTWTAYISGGTSPYTYSWAGDEGVFGKTTQSFSVAYQSSGTKKATVTVTDSSGTSGYTSVVRTAHGGYACSGTDTGYGTDPDTSGWGPGIISNGWLTQPIGSDGSAPPGYSSNPQNYCLQLKQGTTQCSGYGTCITNSTWSYEWYNGSGITPGTYNYTPYGQTYLFESWTYAKNTTSGTPNATVTEACSPNVTVTNQSCTSAPNSCGQTTTGELVNGVCTGLTPPDSNCPAAAATLTATSPIIAGGSSTLTYSCTNSSSASINNGVGAVTASGSHTVAVSPSTTTTYTLTCNGYNGTPVTKAATVTVYPVLTASCSGSPATASTGQSVTWDSSVSGGTGSYTYSWSGTDSLSGSASGVTKQYSSAGTKTASVTVTSGTQVKTVSCSNSVTISQTGLSGSCQVTPSSGATGDTFNWNTSVTGGIGSYLYSWSGSDGLSGSGASVAKQYVTTGTKTGAVTVTSGSETLPITCTTGAGGTGAPSITVTPPLSALLTATPSSVLQGGSSQLTWLSSGATSCSGTNFATGGATSGAVTVAPGATTTYSLTCTNGSSNAFSNATVTVVPMNLSIGASPVLVRSGDSSTITWGATGSVDSCSISGPGLSTTGVSGSRSVTVTDAATYTLACVSGALNSSVSTTVNIIPKFLEF